MKLRKEFIGSHSPDGFGAHGDKKYPTVKYTAGSFILWAYFFFFFFCRRSLTSCSDTLHHGFSNSSMQQFTVIVHRAVANNALAQTTNDVGIVYRNFNVKFGVCKTRWS